uniref:Uncharacterized protein n=1 Tax=Arundo donax TaxID=35708 RepID=A0A0A8YQF7_ARUDO
MVGEGISGTQGFRRNSKMLPL